jgi:predicted Rossmann fold flavoprotein
VARELAQSGKAIINCNWKSLDQAEYLKRFALWQKESGKKQLNTLLATDFPSAFAHSLCEISDVPEDKRVSQLRGNERDRLIAALCNYPLQICATEGWNKAMATSGGVPLSEVNAKTLESRITSGLFFAGEMLNVNAPCGGYNIQWAISSGRLAGKSAAK